jgi:hypothetical protein
VGVRRQVAQHAIEETVAVGFQRDCVRLLGKPAGLQVWLSMPPPPHVARYQRACTLLRDSAQPIEQIGARLGYGSPAAFSTAFRNCSGTSPRTYRKAVRGERASPGASRSDTL